MAAPRCKPRICSTSWCLRNHRFLGFHDGNGLWQIPLVDKTKEYAYKLSTKDARFHDETIHNVYKLPLMEQVFWFLHAALGFPIKHMLLAAINNGYLTTFLGLTTSNVNKFFPNSNKMKKGHMEEQRQGTIQPSRWLHQLNHCKCQESSIMTSSCGFLMPPNEACLLTKTENFLWCLAKGTSTSWWPLKWTAIILMQNQCKHTRTVHSLTPTKLSCIIELQQSSSPWTGTYSTMKCPRN